MDTIAAIATAPGRAAIGVARASGPAVPALIQACLGGPLPPRLASLRTFRDAAGRPIDTGIALYFPAPASYTGEDLLEIHAHGSPVVLGQILGALITAGARHARPGEFTERAFLAGKMDLLQAEAVADLINAQTEAAARAGARALQGALAGEIHRLIAALDELRVALEAEIDFPEDTALEEEAIAARLAALLGELDGLLAAAAVGQRLGEGLEVVLLGPPNAGKSTLLNRLAREERAIVSPRPGTTRDLVHCELDLQGLAVRITDTAGLQETTDPVEREGIRRAMAAAARADVVLLLVPPEAGGPAVALLALAGLMVGEGLGDGLADPAWTPNQFTNQVTKQTAPRTPRRAILRTQIDRSGAPAQRGEHAGLPLIALSAVSGAGLPLLTDYLLEVAGLAGAGEPTFLARARHLDGLRAARAALAEARGSTPGAAPAPSPAQGLTMDPAGPALPPELRAESLRQARRALAVLTGEYGSEDLLGQIFASFCLGK
jgi:tRNA modification GTPase